MRDRVATVPRGIEFTGDGIALQRVLSRNSNSCLHKKTISVRLVVLTITYRKDRAFFGVYNYVSALFRAVEDYCISCSGSVVLTDSFCRKQK